MKLSSDPGYDTARSDLGLVAAGAVSFLLFFWVFYLLHPFSMADYGLGKQNAQRSAAEIAEEFQFLSDDHVATEFRTESELLDSLQSVVNFREFYTNPLQRSLYPVFYWRNELLIERAERQRTIGFQERTARTIYLNLNENGELISLENPVELLPLPGIRTAILRDALGWEIPDELFEPTGEDLKIFFNFEAEPSLENAEPDWNSVLLSAELELNRQAAEKVALYYLDQSAWPSYHFYSESAELKTFSDRDAAVVTFALTTPPIQPDYRIVVTILPDGSLLSLEREFRFQNDTVGNFENILSALQSIAILVFVFWIIILLFIRFRQRLVDTKAAILVAVIAGFIIPALILLSEIYTYLHEFGEADLFFYSGLLVGMGFLAAISSVGYFSVTAISDSITRQAWKEKLRGVDLLRSGHFFNVPLGRAIVRGISWGFIVALVWSAALLFIPGLHFTPKTGLYGDSTFIPYMTLFFENAVFGLLITQIVYLIFVGMIKKSFRSELIIFPAVFLLLLLLDPLPFTFSSYTGVVVTYTLASLIYSWVYIKDDFLTLLISVLVFLTMITTSPGWLLAHSPDTLTFILSVILLAAAFIYGATNISKGKSADELPEFVPNYLLELASENRMKQELQIARKVQQSFLPTKTPDTKHLDIAAFCKPAFETGGDYYDFIRIDEDRLAIAIGDVSGKGIQAAFFMTFTKGLLHALCNEYGSATEVMKRTNLIFRKNADRGTFISIIFGILDEKKSEFHFSRAGHNPLLYYNAREKQLALFQPQGLAVGMANHEVFSKYITEKVITLEKEDIIILFTDGIVEAVNKKNSSYGEKRLHQLIRKYNRLSAAEIVRKIEEDLNSFGEETEQNDDMTIVVIKKNHE